jgi:hypothetical protein
MRTRRSCAVVGGKVADIGDDGRDLGQRPARVEAFDLRARGRMGVPPPVLPSVRIDGSIMKFKDIKQPVLLLGGTKSPHFLKRLLDKLEQIIPDATRVEITGVDHAAAWNVERRNPHGNPTAVAKVVKTYFTTVTGRGMVSKVISSRGEVPSEKSR